MRGKVLVEKLNVRERPQIDARALGMLRQDNIVDILGEEEDWYEIRFENRHAYAANRYIEPLKQLESQSARVIASTLNVRARPGLEGTVLGQLSRGMAVTVVAEHGDWLEIAFNGEPGFIHKSYVEFYAAQPWQQGTVNARSLNVRSAPGLQGRIVGSLSYGTSVSVKATQGQWCEIIFNGSSAFVAARYLTLEGATEQSQILSTEPVRAEDDVLDIGQLELAPQHKLDVDGSGKPLTVARTWNRLGNLLQVLARRHQLETACAIAVLCVESGGTGYRDDNQGRMIIRFENHKFWKYWGRDNETLFHQHFRMNHTGEPWKGHQWRNNADGDWLDFHGNQAREWQVLEFARGLDDSAALFSISMGAPQIMGFNYADLGYATVQAMFERFSDSGGMRYQVEGLFSFLSPTMLSALRDKDFESFAGAYNGSGQKQQYGQWIQEYYDIYNRIHG